MSWINDLPNSVALMDSSFLADPRACAMLIPLLERAGNKPVILPWSIRSELTDNRLDDALTAEEGLSARELCTWRGNDEETTPHPAILLREAIRLRLDHPVIVFSQDPQRLHDLSLLNQHSSYQRDAKPVHPISWSSSGGFAETHTNPASAIPRHLHSRWTQCLAPVDAKVVVDTNVLMTPHVEVALRRIYGEQSTPAPLILPWSSRKELSNLMKPGRDTTQKAKDALAVAQRLREDGIVVWRGDDEDPNFLDPVIIGRSIQLASSSPVVVLTNDAELTADLLLANEMRSLPLTVCVIRISRQGRVRAGQPRHETRSPSQRRHDMPPTRRAFRYALHPNECRTVASNVTATPQGGDTVRLEKGSPLKLLDDQPIRGGEGTVYRTSDPNLLCKVFHPKQCTPLRQQKVRRMTQIPSPSRAIAWPLQPVTDAHGEIVGFTMRSMPGAPVLTEVCNPQILEQRHPEWTRAMLVDICVEIATLVSVLHRMGVVLGDIRPSNFLVTDAGHIALVDMDSAQIDDLPCMVGTSNFTPPQLQGQVFGDFLRTPEDDEFALAVLLFMILMPGKSPYARMGGSDLVENMRAAQFPYKFDDEEGEPPPGKWPFIWNNFPYRIKEAFTDVFRSDDRWTAEDWLAILELYRSDLARGYLSNEIFPLTFKTSDPGRSVRTLFTCDQCERYFTDMSGNPNVRYKGKTCCQGCRGEQRTCSRCGDSFRTMRTNYAKPLCSNCLALRVAKTCSVCGSSFNVFPNEYSKTLGRDMCRRCAKQEGDNIACSQCGASFLWSYGQQEYFRDHDLSRPKRCPDCRTRNRTT